MQQPLRPVRVQRKPMSDINVVPYIDVMLVLLVIFMMTAPMLTQGIKVDLPEASDKPLSRNEEPLIISVKKDGSYYFNLNKQQKKAITLKALTEQVQKVVRARPSVQVLVEGDRDVSYGRVITLMSYLSSAGVQGVGLVTEPLKGQP